MWLRGLEIGGSGEVGRWVRRGYARNLEARVYCRLAIQRTLDRPCTARVWLRHRECSTGVLQSGSRSRRLGKGSWLLL